MSPTDKDLFNEEQTMVAMSFGDHLEELRVRLILAVLFLMGGVVLTFIPPLSLGMRVTRKMQAPAEAALDKFYTERSKVRAETARQNDTQSRPVEVTIPVDALIEQFHDAVPELKLPPAESFKGKTMKVPMRWAESDLIPVINESTEKRSNVITLAPLEGITIFFSVCIVTGLVLASPFVFYQLWAFIGAGLYRHERHYVKKFLPFSLGLFLSGVFMCFFIVLPYTLSFLLEFNVWLGIEPNLRLSDWMSFATILPLVFGLCFQTPLVMLFLARVGIVSVEDMRAKRKFAILIMAIIAAVITPTPDPFTMMVLAVPMIALYELGLFLIGTKKKDRVPASVAG
jgi:sec-independent protein translocase protein TatC